MARWCSSASDPQGDSFVLPSWPPFAGSLARALVGLSLLMAFTWGASIAWAAWQGRASWQSAATAALMLGLMGTAPIKVLRQLRHEHVFMRLYWSRNWLKNRPDDAAWGLRAASHWRDHEGLPVDVSVVFDVGSWLLVKTIGIDPKTTSHHWVSDAQLTGPWRWRLVHAAPVRSDKRLALVASSASSSSKSSPLLTSTHHASNPKQARRSLASDFAPTQALDEACPSSAAAKASA